MVMKKFDKKDGTKDKCRSVTPPKAESGIPCSTNDSNAKPGDLTDLSQKNADSSVKSKGLSHDTDLSKKLNVRSKANKHMPTWRTLTSRKKTRNPLSKSSTTRVTVTA